MLTTFITPFGRFNFSNLTDSRLQLPGQPFSDFAAEYGFCHVNSSPKFPQSNGEAECAVQRVKNLLKKAVDPYLALLAYWSTPLQNGFSLAQQLMGRQLLTTVTSLAKHSSGQLKGKGEWFSKASTSVTESATSADSHLENRCE